MRGVCPVDYGQRAQFVFAERGVVQHDRMIRPDRASACLALVPRRIHDDGTVAAGQSAAAWASMWSGHAGQDRLPV